MSLYPSSHVDESRLCSRIEAMARFGATEKGGVNRQALSAEDIQAQKEMIRWGRQLKLDASIDPAGNLFLRLKGADDSAEPVLSGSHLDSQPSGGKYDGAFGVLAAFEAVQAIQSAGIPLRRHIDIVAWMNEEGSRFAPGMAGSAAFAGSRTLDEIRQVVDAQGVSVGQALDTVMAELSELPIRPLGFPVSAYIEAHIEQGPVLERENMVIGVVTGIQGKKTYRVTVTGETAHAGTSCRAERRDALLASVAIIRALTTHMHDKEDVVKFTIGRLNIQPNAPSVVPGVAVFSIDLRHPDSKILSILGDAIPIICQAHADPCQVVVEELSSAASLVFTPSIRRCIAQAAQRLGLPQREINSAAGHDARYLNDVCATGMIFVPCHLGITHNEAESATPKDLADGARVLADVLAELAA
ncbi:MAG: M20 family metallo-hydrolase [Paralcaligenes sp.]